MNFPAEAVDVLAIARAWFSWSLLSFSAGGSAVEATGTIKGKTNCQTDPSLLHALKPLILMCNDILLLFLAIFLSL